MNSRLKWGLVALGLALWIGGTFAVYHFRDEATRLTESDMARPDYHGRGADLLKIYDLHLAETRGERLFFNIVEYSGLGLAVFSWQLVRKIQANKNDFGRPCGTCD